MLHEVLDLKDLAAGTLEAGTSDATIDVDPWELKRMVGGRGAGKYQGRCK